MNGNGDGKDSVSNYDDNGEQVSTLISSRSCSSSFKEDENRNIEIELTLEERKREAVSVL